MTKTHFILLIGKEMINS